jgi:hypothetical protein
MSAYLRLGSRLLILSSLVLMVVLSQPKPALAGNVGCRGQCIQNYRACIAGCSSDPACENFCAVESNACIQDCGG